MSDGIPTVNLNDAPAPVPAAKKRKAKAKVKTKTKTKAAARKSKAKVKSKKPAPATKKHSTAPRLDQVPAEMAPPAMNEPLAPHIERELEGQAALARFKETGEQPSKPIEPVKPAPVIHNPNDTRLVQGATCTWIGIMGEAPDDTQGIPSCPHCGGHLLTVAGGEETMELGFEAYQLGAYTAVNPPPRPHPGYQAFMRWVRGADKCWVSPDVAADAYYEETGIRVDPSR